MPKKNSHLTIEKFSQKFDSQFDLVNHAITVANHLIISGRPPRVKVNSQNPAVQTLAEIREGKDAINDIELEEDKGEFQGFKTSE